MLRVNGFADARARNCTHHFVLNAPQHYLKSYSLLHASIKYGRLKLTSLLLSATLSLNASWMLVENISLGFVFHCAVHEFALFHWCCYLCYYYLCCPLGRAVRCDFIGKDSSSRQRELTGVWNVFTPVMERDRILLEQWGQLSTLKCCSIQKYIVDRSVDRSSSRRLSNEVWPIYMLFDDLNWGSLVTDVVSSWKHCLLSNLLWNLFFTTAKWSWNGKLYLMWWFLLATRCHRVIPSWRSSH